MVYRYWIVLRFIKKFKYYVLKKVSKWRKSPTKSDKQCLTKLAKRRTEEKRNKKKRSTMKERWHEESGLFGLMLIREEKEEVWCVITASEGLLCTRTWWKQLISCLGRRITYIPPLSSSVLVVACALILLVNPVHGTVGKDMSKDQEKICNLTRNKEKLLEVIMRPYLLKMEYMRGLKFSRNAKGWNWVS